MSTIYSPLGEALKQEVNYQRTAMLASAAIFDTLTLKKNKLEKELSAVNSALAAVAKYPEVAEVLDLVGKAINPNS